MLPFIDKCRDLGIAVLVMNPNYTRCPETGTVIPYAYSMSDHACFVWDHYIEKSGFTELYVVAHSAGGGCLASIQRQFSSTFYEQVSKIAYTDSWVIAASELNQE